MITFALLGEIGLELDDGTPVHALLRQPKRLALLAYLVSPTPGTWHRRDTLLALFWPELDQSRARTSLRNALYVLRQTLGDDVVLTRGDDEVSVDAERIVTDVSALRVALRAGRVPEAMSCYRGDLLPGLFPPESDGFERWLDTERAQLRREVARAAIDHSVRLERDGRVSEALETAEWVLRIHPDDEPTVRRVMGLLDAKGDRSGALRAFEEYRTRIATELDAEPTPETVQAALRLRAQTVVGRDVVERRGMSGVSPGSVSPMPADAAPSLSPQVGVLDAGVPRALLPARRSSGRGVAWTMALVVVGVVFWRILQPTPAAQLEFMRNVTTEERLQVEPALSPDSALVAYAAGTTRRMQIHVQRIADGSQWTLTGDTSAFELTPRWSPDGRQLLYLAHNGAYVAASSNGAPRLVAEGGAGDDMIRSASWSPGGDSIALVRNNRLYVQKLFESGMRVIGTRTQLHGCVWSPNGKWIACVSGNWVAYTPGALFGNRAHSVIVLFPAGGGESVELTDRQHRYDSPVWSSDSRVLYVVSNLDGTPGDVYGIPLTRAGQVAKPFQRIPTGQDVEGISVRGSLLAYSVRTNRETVWSVPIPARGIATLREARALTRGAQVNEVLRTSRDGAWLVYDSDSIRDADLYRMPVGGGAVLRLTSDARPEFAGDLSPDNRELAYQILTNNERQVQVKNLETGTVTDVFASTGDRGLPRWSPDARSLVGWVHIQEKGAIFVVHRNAAGRWQPESWRLSNAQFPVWSPDGRTIAYVQQTGGVFTIPADSGPSRQLYAPRPGTDDPKATYLAWRDSPDTLWFLADGANGGCGIWSLPVSQGPPTLRVQLEMPDSRHCGRTITTDGTRFFFTLAEQISNLRMGRLKKERD